MNKALLRSKIFLRYPSRTAFAEVMGWPRARVTQLLNYRDDVSLATAQRIAQVLNLTSDEIAEIFFDVSLPNGNENEEVEHGKIDA